MDDPYGELMKTLNSRAGSRSDAELRAKNRHESFPLADIQHAYLVGRRRGLELGGVSSHSYFEFDCPALDLSRLTTALRAVVDRHDMLRAVTVPDGGQRVLDEVPPYEIACTDLRGHRDAEQAAELGRLRGQLGDVVRPTNQWPLFDVRVTVLDDDRMRLHFGIDLLFVDMRSLFVLLAEWYRFYDDATYSPVPLEATFRDHVLARQALLDEAEGARAQRYWLSRLGELPAAPDLAIATAPERLGRPEFVRLSTTVDEQHWAAFRAAVEPRGLTPEGALLAAYCEVLRAWSKRQDFTLTVALLDRQPLRPQIHDVVGDFLTPSLLAVPDRGDQTFINRACAVQRQQLADEERATFGGIRVLRELTRAQADGRNIAMPVVFSSTLGSEPGADTLGLFGELVHSADQTPQIWLENQILESAGGIVLNWNAVAGLFPAGMLEAMFDAYQALLHRMADDETVWHSTGSVVDLPATHIGERDWANDTATDLPARRLHELVAAAAERTPDAVAVIAEGAEVTYRELTEDAHRLAHRLRKTGAGEPNTLVAVTMRPGSALISALLGVLHSGAAYVSIDPDLPEQRRLALLGRCRASAVITDTELRERLSWPAGLVVITAEDQATRRCAAEPAASGQSLDDLAYVIFTSGSTGEPKGVMISHRAAGNTVQDINQRFGVDPTDRVLALAPTGFDLSVYDIFGVLSAGGAVVIPAPERTNDTSHWTELVDRHRVTIWNSVPAPMRLWIESLSGGAPGSGASVRLALLSGDWIPTSLPGQIRDRFPEMAVISLGGATEASIWSVFYPIGAVSRAWASIPYGKPLANQTLHVYNDRLEPCPTWVTGEIYIGGVGVAIGYWADPERTAERFVIHPHTGDRLYRTGDLGRYLPGGDIEILGRTDFQVKINGYRVELGEIEAALSQRPGIRQALVAAPVYPHTGQRQLAAYLVVDDPATADPVRLRTALGEVLPGYMVPNHYVSIDALPVTTNGKIDHAALPTPWHGGAETETRVSPRSDVEQRLLRIWSEQLGHDDLGVDDGFFDVGGDSLHAVAIVGHLRSEFKIDSDTEQEVIEGLFTNATIAEFAEIIRSVAGLQA